MATMIRLNVRTGADDCQLVGSGSDPPQPETAVDVQLFRVAI